MEDHFKTELKKLRGSGRITSEQESFLIANFKKQAIEKQEEWNTSPDEILGHYKTDSYLLLKIMGNTRRTALNTAFVTWYLIITSVIAGMAIISSM